MKIDDESSKTEGSTDGRKRRAEKLPSRWYIQHVDIEEEDLIGKGNAGGLIKLDAIVRC